MSNKPVALQFGTDRERELLAMDDDELENEDEDLEETEDLADDLDDDSDDDDSDDDDSDDDDSDEDSDDDDESGDDDSDDDEPGDDEKAAADPEPGDVVLPDLKEVGNIDEMETSLSGINEELSKLKERWDEGDLEDDEYWDQRDSLKDKAADLKMDIRDAKRDAESNQERIQDRWNTAQDVFYENPANVIFRENGLMMQALNAEIARRQQEKDFDGNFTRLLNESASELRKSAAAMLGVEGDSDKGGDKKPMTAKEKAAAKKAANARGDKPRTLRGVNSADDNSDIDQGEFADLDRLKGRSLELAISRLSPEQQERWMKDGLDY